MRGGRTEDRERAPRGMTQPALAGLGVTLARLAGLFGMLITSRGPGTLHVLSTPYELLGDKRVSISRAHGQAAEIRGAETRVKCPMCPVCVRVVMAPLSKTSNLIRADLT